MDICNNPILNFPQRGTRNFFGIRNCTMTATLPPRSWIKLNSYSYVLWAQTYFPHCSQEFIYVEVQRKPIADKAYLCGTGGIKPLLTGFHMGESALEVKMRTLGVTTSYFTLSFLRKPQNLIPLLINNYFQFFSSITRIMSDFLLLFCSCPCDISRRECSL